MENTKLKIGIVGYGNLGKGVELSLQQNPDFELIAIFTRRPSSDLDTPSKVVSFSQIEEYKDLIDVMILCGGSAKDLPEQVARIAENFNTVDSFDTHAKIPAYFEQVNETATKNKTLSLISTGWDPGLFSLMRVLGQSILPQSSEYTFWGKGLSQGHSDAVRRVPGVKLAAQYTIPLDEAIEKVRKGENPTLSTAEKHQRVCYVVAKEGADLDEIKESITEMPHYFKEYKTFVNFISEEEYHKEHSAMPHGGMVMHSGESGNGAKQRIEFSLNLESNPEFTASVLITYARAVGKMAKEDQIGAKTVFDIPIGYLSPKSAEQLRKDSL